MHRKTLRNALPVLGIMGVAVALSMALSRIHDDNNPFAMPLFILAVALCARLTDGYFYGIAASVMGTFCVNYMFTYPFWTFDVSLSGYPLTFAVMLVVSVIISALTTRLKQQEQLHLEAEREKMRANLLRAIAHDIRTPLASILGASSALKEQTLPAGDQAALIAGIHRDARWLVRLTENLLSVTRVSGEGAALKKTDEVLEEIIGSAVVKYRRSPEALPVRVDTLDCLPIVPMDATLIEQVLLNLFDNVSAHARGATAIWLHITCGADQVTLSVEDDGAGIPKELRTGNKLFEGGTASGRKESGRGMGIGLSVCRSIVRAHGGDMRAQASRHGGAAITFSLPCMEKNYV